MPPTQPTPEQPIQPTGEQQPTPAAPEAAPAVPQGTTQPVQLPQVPNVPAPPLPVVSNDQPTAPSPVQGPQVAEDVDIIEKEWVDQADKIIKETKDDPYLEEEAVESLQQDYLKKRYGHEVKKPDEA